jgi:hypothetical protein
MELSEISKDEQAGVFSLLKIHNNFPFEFIFALWIKKQSFISRNQ